MFSPDGYLKRYHQLIVNDYLQDIFESVDIQNYCSGWSQKRQDEYDLLVQKLTPKAGGSALPSSFYIRKEALIDETEVWYRQGLRRAYLGKGSPEEISDAIRLANLCGLIKPGRAGAGDVKTYVKSFMGLDCNGFLGNYYGISPEVKPRAWAQGMTVPVEESARAKAGITKAIALTLALFPLAARRSPRDIAIGDVVITLKNDAPVFSHEHIAMVSSISVSGDTASIGIAEWGTAGGIGAHANTAPNVTLISNSPATKQWKSYGLAWKTDEGKYRHIFAPPCAPNPSGWGRCGVADV